MQTLQEKLTSLVNTYFADTHCYMPENLAMTAFLRQHVKVELTDFILQLRLNLDKQERLCDENGKDDPIYGQFVQLTQAIDWHEAREYVQNDGLHRIYDSGNGVTIEHWDLDNQEWYPEIDRAHDLESAIVRLNGNATTDLPTTECEDYWLVSEWLFESLKAKGEHVLEFKGMKIWGRNDRFNYHWEDEIEDMPILWECFSDSLSTQQVDQLALKLAFSEIVSNIAI